MSMLHWSISLPFLVAILIPFLSKYARKIHTGWFTLVVPVTLFSFFCSLIPQISERSNIKESVSWIPSLNISFDVYVDGLGLLFAMLISGIGALVILYSIFYLDKNKERLNHFYVYLLLFMGAMLGVVLSDNLIVLYTFWEFTSLSSFLLIGYWHERKASRYGAQKSLLITFFGGLSMLGGFITLSVMGGTFSIRELISMAPELVAHPLFYFAMILVLLGAFTKSAQFPFHIWLPDAMEAPTPVSAYLHSATMVKAGIYLVARLSPIFATSGVWMWLVGGIGILTLFWGSFNAVKQHDLKGILAFSTVSQLGMIMSMLGLGSAALHYDANQNLYVAAVVAAIFHLINHATFKGSLFMMVGIIDHETGTRDIRKLGGLMNIMPVTFTIALIGTFSMAGLPPFNGFLSKEMFFASMLQITEANLFSLDTWGMLFPVIAWIASVFTFIYSMIVLFKTFTGKPQLEKLDKKPHEAPIGMLISPIILASLVLIFGLFPNLLSHSIIEPATASILPGLYENGVPYDIHFSLWHGFQPELFMTIGVVVIGILLFRSLYKWQGIYGIYPERYTLNSFYNNGLTGIDSTSRFITRGYMTGKIRSYLIYIFGFMILILLFTMWDKNAFYLNTTNVSPIGVYELILALILVLAASMILFAKSRLTSIILLGAVGYTMSLLFVLFRAPDLALTQFVIETVSTSLFLLCFYHLPKFKPKEKRITFRLTNMIIAVGVGVTMTLIALSAHSNKLFSSISDYYKEVTYKEAGGENMVNVILVDFRGLDTMFEISVLAIAAIGIYTMIKLRLTKKEGENENK